MAWPTDPLTVYTELQIGGAWSDVSASPYLRNMITVTGGRQDEGSHVDPASCTLTINNRSNTYSPRNPMSPLYGLIGRNTPLRMSVAAGSCFLRATDDTEPDAQVSTPSTTALNITGDMDLRFDVEADDWDTANVTEVAGKLGGAGQNAWYLLLSAGVVRLGWSTDGTAITEAAATVQAVTHPRRMCIRATVDVNNGAGGRTVQFFTGPTLNGPWTQIGGDNVVPGTSATASSTAPLEIGDLTHITSVANAGCRIYGAQIRSGIDGTIVASPDFTAQAAGALTFTDSTGVPWTANGTAAITNRRPRHVGEVSAWPQRWDVDGKDVYVPIQSSGIMRRLGQGASPLDSALRRTLEDAEPVAYWPLEDGSASTQAASGLLGGTPMRVMAGAPSFGSTDGPPGSLALPDFSNGGTLAAGIPAGSSSSWTIEAVMKFGNSLPAGFSAPLSWVAAGSRAVNWEMDANPAGSGGLSLQWANADFSDFGGPYDSNIGVTDEKWHHVRVTVQQDGTGIDVFMWLDDVLVVSVTEPSVTLGALRSVTINQTQAVDEGVPSLGHLAVWSPATDLPTYPAVSGYSGDWADTRLFRLTGEEGVPLIAPYGVAGKTPLGPQRSDTLLNLLQEASDADVGILYEPRHMVALAARSRESLYNQTAAVALNYQADGEVPPPLQPTEDDALTRNDITRSRPNGSSARVTLDAGTLSTQPPPDGVGRYADSQSVNVEGDDQLEDIASWWLHLGTWDEARYPQVTVDLRAAPWLIDQVTAVEVGDRITISNLPPWVAPGAVDLLVQGYNETIGVYDWTVTFNCTPAGPWQIALLDDPVLGRADTDGSALAAAAGASDTHLLVQVNAGPAWVTDLAELPLDLRLGGEVVTVTDSLSGPAGDRFDRTVASGWGTATSGQAWTTTGGSASDYSVSGG